MMTWVGPRYPSYQRPRCAIIVISTWPRQSAPWVADEWWQSFCPFEAVDHTVLLVTFVAGVGEMALFFSVSYSRWPKPKYHGIWAKVRVLIIQSLVHTCTGLLGSMTWTWFNVNRLSGWMPSKEMYNIFGLSATWSFPLRSMD